MQGVLKSCGSVLAAYVTRLRVCETYTRIRIYAALGNSVFSFEIKNMQIGHKFDNSFRLGYS